MACENGRISSWARHVGLCIAALATCSASCATYPKAHDGTAIQAQRGYWVEETQFTQRGRKVDRASAKQILVDHEESAGAANRGRVFEGMAVIAAIVSGAALGWGLADALDASKTDKRSVNTLLGVGAGFLGVSIGCAIGADGSYVSAAELYNGASTPKGRD